VTSTRTLLEVLEDADEVLRRRRRLGRPPRGRPAFSPLDDVLGGGCAPVS
jgi:hypothetical protein